RVKTDAARREAVGVANANGLRECPLIRVNRRPVRWTPSHCEIPHSHCAVTPRGTSSEERDLPTHHGPDLHSGRLSVQKLADQNRGVKRESVPRQARQPMRTAFRSENPISQCQSWVMISIQRTSHRTPFHLVL